LENRVYKVDVIPLRNNLVGEATKLNREAICVFAAIGFFLNEDTYYKGQRVLRPGTMYATDESGKPVGEGKPWFTWHYEPRNLTLAQATDEFEQVFTQVVNRLAGDDKLILPLSGGLDSRTLALALHAQQKPVHAYSYSFEGGIDESWYGKEIARVCGFPFEAWRVPHGYLWKHIDQLAQLNGCYAEFTHPRQMAFIDRYAPLGDRFMLGHWGDVLFDDMGVPDDLTLDQQVDAVLKKIVKRGGMEFGSALWQAWRLPGDLKSCLHDRVKQLLKQIDIPYSANARIRAFKSLHWATRWTAANLGIFQAVRPIAVPYFTEALCRFICTVPEKHLAARQIQIEYIKRRNPALARIPWQQHRPFNLYTYKWNKPPYYWPYVAWMKINRWVNRSKLIQRNWELQFIGEENDWALRHALFENDAFRAWIPEQVTAKFYQKFVQQNVVQYSHPVSMLLTIAMAARQYTQNDR
jgi:Asparagine synthase